MRYEDIEDADSEASKIADQLMNEVGDTSLLELIATKIQTALRRVSILRALGDNDNKNTME